MAEGAASGVLHVGCSSSTEYLPHAATMLHSMLSQAGGMEVRARLLHGSSMQREDAQRVVDMVERAGGTLTLHEIAGERIAGLPALAHAGIPATMWYRIFLPELLDDVERNPLRRRRHGCGRFARAAVGDRSRRPLPRRRHEPVGALERRLPDAPGPAAVRPGRLLRRRRDPDEPCADAPRRLHAHVAGVGAQARLGDHVSRGP